MKKILIVTTFLLSFIVFVSLIGCTSNKPNTTPPPITPQPSTTAPQPTTPQPSSGTNTTNKSFTLEELKKYTGQNGTPAYAAVNGIVYDVSNTKGWRNGKHQDGAAAGMDLTSMMSQSPHGNSVLSNLPVVGALK